MTAGSRKVSCADGAWRQVSAHRRASTHHDRRQQPDQPLQHIDVHVHGLQRRVQLVVREVGNIFRQSVDVHAGGRSCARHVLGCESEATHWSHCRTPSDGRLALTSACSPLPLLTPSPFLMWMMSGRRTPQRLQDVCSALILLQNFLLREQMATPIPARVAARSLLALLRLPTPCCSLHRRCCHFLTASP